ncbi:MAG TPA: thiol reductant ABC exporter subunit CydD [Acidiferrobacter sp.]|nr:thiol reductant ABC exporter subunit CydD [Acidiferrobacter sp.]
MDTTAWLRREGQQLRGPLKHVALLTTLNALVIVAQAWLLADVLTGALFAHVPLSELWQPCLGLLLLAPLRALLSIRARRTAFDASVAVGTHLRRRLLDRAQALGPLGLAAEASGDLITRLVDGVDAVLPYFARYLPQVTAAAIVPLVLAAFIFPADWVSGCVLIVSAPLIPVFMVLVGQSAERASQKRFRQLTRLGAAFMDTLGGLTTLRQLGAAYRIADQLDSEGEDYRRLTMEVLRIAFLSALVLEFFAMVSIAVVAVLIGFRLLWKEMLFQDGLFVLLLAPEFYSPLRALGALRHARMDALAAADHLIALENHEVPHITQKNASLAPPRGAPALTFDDVYFAYADGRTALTGCSFRAASTGITTIVGASGGGKSTILKLVLGFAQPASGSVRIEGADLSELDLAQWHECVAWIPQQPHIFEGTVRDNLLLAAPGAEDSAIRRAVADSGLHYVVARLPQGLETPLGEHGFGLSGGELQRLAVARALLREQATVWLWDEATAHLDKESARAIADVIQIASRTRTILLIAHRLALAQISQWVVVLGGGRVLEEGAPAALAKASGPYQRLLQAEAR